MGLLKTGLKAVVAVKTADVIHERVLERQQAHAASHGYPGSTTVAQPPPAAAIAAAPPPGPADMSEKLTQLTRLGELRTAGVLSDAEFDLQKAQILGA